MQYTVITAYVAENYREITGDEQLNRFIDKVSEKCNDGWKLAGGVSMSPITNHQGETKLILYSQALTKE